MQRPLHRPHEGQLGVAFQIKRAELRGGLIFEKGKAFQRGIFAFISHQNGFFFSKSWKAKQSHETGISNRSTSRWLLHQVHFRKSRTNGLNCSSFNLSGREELSAAVPLYAVSFWGLGSPSPAWHLPHRNFWIQCTRLYFVPEITARENGNCHFLLNNTKNQSKCLK